MAESDRLSRRAFLGRTVGLGTATVAMPYFVRSAALAATGRKGANDRINVAVIGTGSLAKGWHFPQLLEQQDVAIVAVCDVWQERLDEAVTRCEGTAKGHRDWREVMQRDDVDAVVIVTPPHWHALQAIAAAEAGKDFYVEKPMTLYPAETLAVLRAVREHNTITQVGTQIHAGDNYRRVVEYVRSGQLGQISSARTFNIMNQGPEGLGDTPDSDPPAGLDWEMWVGPAVMRRFNPLITHDAYTHSSFMAYSGGWTPGMAPHIIDLPCWALNLDAPRRTTAIGGRYVIQDPGDAYDSQQVLWEYDKFAMHWNTSLVNSYGMDFQGEAGMRRRLGVYLHGVNGTLMADYGTMRIVPEGDRMKDAQTPPESIPASKGHHREWLDCIRSREQATCHVGYHYKLDLALTLANLSMRLKRTIEFDPQALKIVGDPEAARLAKPTYRDPWKLPEKYL